VLRGSGQEVRMRPSDIRAEDQPSRSPGSGRRTLPRPPTPAGIDPAALVAVHEATRALLDATTPQEAVEVVLGLVTTLGAVVVPARLAAPNTLPLDLSFGTTEPLLAASEPAGIPRLHVEVLLPSFLEDARRVVMDLRQTAQLRDEASHDALTGLLNRRSLDRRMHQLGPGDAIAIIDLDHFKALNDSAGHAAGDKVLAAFGRLLCNHVRSDDLAARYGGEEMLIALFGGGAEILVQRVDQIRRAWAMVRPHPVSFSAGIASVSGTAEEALHRADEALYAAKRAGRNRTAVRP
jgi:diguanylate cyclase (GGDEF)-like protein